MLIFKNDVIHNVHCYFVFFGIPVVILSIYRINVFFCLKNKLKIPNRPHTSNNCSELRKRYKQHSYLDKNNSRHTVNFFPFSRHTVNFLDVSRHTLNPIETLWGGENSRRCFEFEGKRVGNCKFCKIADGNHGDITVIYRKKGFYKRRSITSFRTKGLFTWRWGTPGR